MWWAENWGNVASVVGLAVSVWAWLKANSVARTLQRFRLSSRQLEALLRAERALHCGQQLQNVAGRRFSQAACDDLRHALSALLDAAVLGAEERYTLRKHVADFRKPLENTDTIRAEVRKLVDLLNSIRSRLRQEVEDRF